MRRRKARGCTRVDLPVVRWEIEERELRRVPTISPIDTTIYQGRYPVDEPPRGYGSKDKPCEAWGDGCPGGWYRSDYVTSVIPYLRRRDDGGGRVRNPLFDNAAWQVQQAAMHVEHHEERWHAEISELLAERARREDEKRKRKQGHHGRRR